MIYRAVIKSSHGPSVFRGKFAFGFLSQQMFFSLRKAVSSLESDMKTKISADIWCFALSF
jgi:hypothetical protein